MIAAAVLSLALAHPLGNFSVNHANDLRLFADRIENTAVVDLAELPTLQERATAASPAARCASLASAQLLEVNGKPVRWRVSSSAFGFQPGAGGLETSRLTCSLTAPADLSRPATVSFADSYIRDRVGWREITASGVGLGLPSAPVPSKSISNGLRTYPSDLLSAPLNQRSVTLRTAPGSGSVGPALPGLPKDGLIGGFLASLDRTFTGLVGGDLTLPVGLLALLLAIVLGAAHALAPGHGKTVMAAYLAGRQGRPRDALTVGLTVTITHTAGVLIVGVLLTVVSSLAGEALLGWLGVVSGALICLVGAGLLRNALPSRRHGRGHDHRHGHGHEHGHGHGHGGDSRTRLVGLGIAGGLVPSPSALVVLLGAVALGRTWFGIGLVLAYGAGMAVTLTAAGLLLVRLTGRLSRLAGRGRGLAGRLAGLTPVVTAGVVVALGAGLVLRGIV